LYKILPKTLFTGRNIVYLPSCHSTNDIAAQLFNTTNVIEGTTVVTSRQTAGRGQRGNTWVTEAGKNLTFSLLLKPVFLPATEQFRLNMVISTGIHQFLKGYVREGVSIKWPNDLYYLDQKLGGILIENTVKNNFLNQSVVGIGLNINQEQFPVAKATSLKNITGRVYDPEILLAQLLECIEPGYLQLRAGNTESVQKEYFSNLYGLNEKRLFKTDTVFSGTIVGVDSIGRLAVESDGRIQYYFFKEIEFI
jgi:BirA family transcriptional regulator, biotin operon repressor / biotin---[acetyl-CoA-carboxylase] ligase